MAKQNIKLKKNIISNSKANQIYSKDFSKIIKSNEPINQDKIIEKYDKLFYDIKIEGKESHKQIVEESYNYLNEPENKKLQTQIDKLIEQLARLGQTLSDLINPSSKEHPIYEDKSFLIAGINGEKYQDMHTIYIMQEGKKRAIGSSQDNELYFAIRRLLGLPEDFSGKYYVDLDSLNQIPDGIPINTFQDLHKKGKELEADYDDILGISAYIDVEFTCKGNEIEDSLNLVLGDDPNAVAQYYLNNDPCKLYYLKDDYTNDELGPEVIELILEKGESKVVRLLREVYLEDYEGFGLNNLPNNIQTYYDQYTNPEAEIIYNGTTIHNYEKLWGPGSEYASVVYAEGRILSQEQYNPSINTEFYQQERDTSTGEILTKIFNGLPSNGSNYFDIVNVPSNLGNQFFGSVRRIYQPGSGYWGALNQSMSFQRDKFNKSNFGYYRKTDRENDGFDISVFFPKIIKKWLGSVYIFKSKDLPIYGQPIIRAYNKNITIAGTKSYGISLPNWLGGGRIAREVILFFDCDAKSFFMESKSSAANTSANIKLNMSNGHIQSIDWGALNKNQLIYIGHKGAKVVGYGSSGQGNDNPFNPKNGGSNYELNGSNTP